MHILHELSPNDDLPDASGSTGIAAIEVRWSNIVDAGYWSSSSTSVHARPIRPW